MLLNKIFKKLNQQGKHIRNFSFQKKSYEAIKIPVPWVHISGKWWGAQDKRPVLAIHGWQDNCGTFDKLIPLLTTQNLGFLAIDLPGHGLSSQLPPGIFYHNIEYVIVVKRIVDYFNWSKVSLMGHSMGGIISYLYSSLYPKNVDFLICFDAFKPVVFKLEEINNVATNLSNFIKYDKINSATTEPPSYTFQELENILHTATGKSVSLKTCKYLLKRNIKASKINPNKYYFTRDPRLKIQTFSLGFAQDFVTDSAYNLICPTFISKSVLRLPHLEDMLDAEDIIEIITKNNTNFEFHDIEGSHHVHLNNPEILIDLLSKFIKRHDIEDRSVNKRK